MPLLIVAVNVSVTMPVDGSCEQLPVGVPVTFASDQLGNSSLWLMLHEIGGPARVQANKMLNAPLEYPHMKLQLPLRVSVPLMKPVGQPVAQLVFGGIGVLGPAVNESVAGSGRLPQHGM